jgi:hypothetical protein
MVHGLAVVVETGDRILLDKTRAALSATWLIHARI